ncbi:maltose acetyltransferase domain-containing protein [Enterococcus eurekensis]|uniref:Maltose acetyltransferase domain-containing protein n=1 Tax=Enterococcus eurekensis TaxID=1159753 RepID=A0ABV9M683_9ENTE
MDLQESVERMHSGKLYYADAPKLVAEQMVYLDKVFAYNQLPPSKQEEKQGLYNF